MRAFQRGALSVLGAGAMTFALAGSANAAILASWDDWGVIANSTYVANNTLAGFSASVRQGANITTRVHNDFGSTDGTFGTVAGASTTGNPALLVRNQTNEHILTLTLTNNTGQAYFIDSVHFDFAPRRDNDSNTGFNGFKLTYETGGLGSTPVEIDSQSDLAYLITGSANAKSDYSDFDYILSNALNDTLLDDGESATFQLVFSGGTNSVNTSSVIDNIAFVGSAIPEPASMALLGMGGWMSLLRRR